MPLDRRLTNIASVYRGKGYLTSAFSAVRFLRGLRPGFEHFRTSARDADLPDAAATVFEDARRWVLAQDPDRKQFLWVHLYDVHEWRSLLESEEPSVWRQEPAAQRAAIDGRLFSEPGIATTYTTSRNEIRAAVDAYDEQITVVDRALEGFYEALTAAGRNDHAVWLVTADHGEGLGAHGNFGHGRHIYGEQLKVPLVLHSTEGHFPSKRVSELVRHVDVAPTLADLAGDSLERQIVPSPGRSLLALASGRRTDDSVGEQAFAQRRPKGERRMRRAWEDGGVFSLQGLRYKLILHTQGPDEFFDLSTDPEEVTNLSGSGLEEEDRLRRRLLELKDRFERDGKRVEAGEIDPEVVDELKALGYL
jgi:arylsulfatase A-like enzyme